MVYEVVKAMEAVAKRFRLDFESPLEKKSSEWVNYVGIMYSSEMLEGDFEDNSFFFEKLKEMYMALKLLADSTYSEQDEELALAWLKAQYVLTKMDPSWGASLEESSKQLKMLLLGYPFPRLVVLQKQLRKKLTDPEGSQKGQAIVFVEKRIAAHIVSEYLKQNEEMQACRITVDYVTATDSVRMHADKIKEYITAFRDGNLDILVSTAVIEEGLDVPNVKIVVLFDLVHSPVVLRQRLGRARDKEPEILILSQRSGRSVDDLQQAQDYQRDVIVSAPKNHAALVSPVNYTADKSRERVAFEKFLLHESKIKERPTALLNEFKDKTKGRLKKTHCVSGSTFQCTLEYASVLRKDGFQASDVGSTKKYAERKCALKILSQLRSALSNDYC